MSGMITYKKLMSVFSVRLASFIRVSLYSSDLRPSRAYCSNLSPLK